MPKGDVKNKNHGLSQVHRITTNKYTASVQPVWSTNTKRGCFWKSWAAISTQHQLQQVHRISINKYTTSMPKGVAFEKSWAGTSTQLQYQPWGSISNSKCTASMPKSMFAKDHGLPSGHGISTNKYAALTQTSTRINARRCFFKQEIMGYQQRTA